MASYFPPRLVHFSQNATPESLVDGISQIAKDIVQQLPGKVVDDSFEIRSGDRAMERGKGMASAESSKLLVTAVSSPCFRRIQWRLKFAEGVVGWTIHGFATPFPRIVFSFDLLLSEEHWISRAAEATVLQVLAHSDTGYAMEVNTA